MTSIQIRPRSAYESLEETCKVSENGKFHSVVSSTGEFFAAHRSLLKTIHAVADVCAAAYPLVYWADWQLSLGSTPAVLSTRGMIALGSFFIASGCSVLSHRFEQSLRETEQEIQHTISQLDDGF